MPPMRPYWMLLEERVSPSLDCSVVSIETESGSPLPRAVPKATRSISIAEGSGPRGAAGKHVGISRQGWSNSPTQHRGRGSRLLNIRGDSLQLDLAKLDDVCTRRHLFM